jgi:hypothetical protein
LGERQKATEKRTVQGASMLRLSFVILSATVAMGGYLLARGRPGLPILHGASGAAGLVALILALRGRALSGVFAQDAAWLLGAGLCGGLAIATFKARGRPVPGLVLLLHATAGGLAYLLLAGFVFGH